MCYGAISRARIQKIYYGNTGKDAAEIGFDDSAFQEDIKKDFTERSIPVEEVLHDEALEVFKAWTDKQDKISY
jgi:tRNA(Arg) A34 adenosine deaminase TadA